VAGPVWLSDLLGVARGLQDQVGDLLRMRDERQMAGLHLDRRRAHTFGHEPLEIGIDCPIFRRNRSLRPLQQQGRELIGHVEHHIMPACKLLPPPAALSCLGVKLAERTFKA
jgi:hypothetical protein